MQDEFSIRMFHRSWGLMMIQQNIPAPSTLLDFPTREQFAAELTSRHYDVVGISSIIVNVGKVREMCRMVRRTLAGFHHHRRRPCRGDPRHRAHDRCRSHRQRRRDLAGCAATLARIPLRRSAIPTSSPDLASAIMGHQDSRQVRAPQPPSFLPSAVPWAATSAPLPRSLAAKGSSQLLRNRATSCYEVMCGHGGAAEA